MTFLWLFHFALAARRLRGKSDLTPVSGRVLLPDFLNSSSNLVLVLFLDTFLCSNIANCLKYFQEVGGV